MNSVVENLVRFNREDVAQFVEQCLSRVSSAEQMKYEGLVEKIRAYPSQYLFCDPGRRVVDVVDYRPCRGT